MNDASEKAIVLHSGLPINPSDEVSIFDIGSTLLRHRWRILVWMVVGGILAFIPVMSRKFTYTATTSFVPQSVDAGPSGLRGLADQFGVSLGARGPAESPQFYADLLTSRVILTPIAADTFSVPELGKGHRTLLSLLGIGAPSRERALQLGVAALARMLSVSVSRETGVLNVGVTTEWPSLSAAIADRLVRGVNAFNLQTRQSQASEERRFTEGRLAEARANLRQAEERLQFFLQSNRQIQYSPQLSLERDRLQRDVELDQEIVTSLSKSLEEVRIREVRDTPLITVIERPSIPTQPNPKGRGKRVLLGMLLGALIGVIITLVRNMLERRRVAGDPEIEAFFGVLSEVKGDVARLTPWRRRAITSGPGSVR